MEIYKIEVKETLARLVEIEADSAEEAMAKVIELYKAEQIILDSDDFVDTEFLEFNND